MSWSIGSLKLSSGTIAPDELEELDELLDEELLLDELELPGLFGSTIKIVNDNSVGDPASSIATTTSVFAPSSTPGAFRP